MELEGVKVKLINLTAHPINFDNGVVLPPHETPVRIKMGCTLLQNLILAEGTEPIPVYEVRARYVLNMPPEEPGVMYVVSLGVAEALKMFGDSRHDGLVPNQIRRGVAREPLGCRSLRKL